MILPTHVVAAGGLVRNDKNEVLLIHNPRNGWEFPGGIVEQGETIYQGLKREIKEETGVNIQIISLVGIYSNTKKRRGYGEVQEIPTVLNIDFICQYIDGEFTSSSESQEVKWFSHDEALMLVNKKQYFRFEKLLNYTTNITCCGFQINDTNSVEILEEVELIK